MIYSAINQAVFLHIPKTAKRILDIGCGSGNLAKELKKNIQCDLIGITYSQLEANSASKYFNKVLVEDLNYFNPCELGQFDCIICSHILEHLYQPDEFLLKLRHILSPNGIVIIALPNALHWKQRLEFLKGNFKYTDGGLMDKTHVRFFDWDTALDLVNNSGFKPILREADGYFPIPLVRKFLKSLVTPFDKWVSTVMPGLFGLQFIIVAKVL